MPVTAALPQFGCAAALGSHCNENKGRFTLAALGSRCYEHKGRFTTAAITTTTTARQIEYAQIVITIGFTTGQFHATKLSKLDMAARRKHQAHLK